MDIYVMNTRFEVVAIVDYYKSLVWTDRYDSYGDFELVVPMSDTVLSDIQIDYYLYCDLSDRVMIVESLDLNTSIEDGVFVTFSGRSLESILDRRVVWGYFNFSGSMQTGIKRLINNNIIDPTDTNRKVGNFIFQDATDINITEIQYDFSLLGENLYDVIHECCVSNDIGFKIILNSTNKFVFSMYVGVDRSYNQTLIPWVIFSPDFDNLISSEYFRSITTKKTVSLVAGEGETEHDRMLVEATVDDGSWEEESRQTKRRWGFPSQSSRYTGRAGLSRREIYTDANDISKTYIDEYGHEQVLSDEEYAKYLINRGQNDLTEYFTTQNFEGDVDYAGQFKYGTDYQLGDILQIENEYGITCPVRTEEVVITVDETGLNVVPSFTAI